jgi:cytochrome c
VFSLKSVFACAALSAAQAFSSQALAVDAKRGKTLYDSRCIACHSINENRVGPAHRGVFGRKAGSAPGYDFSAALRASQVIWNESTLDRFLANPEATIPGQKMGFAVPEAADRADIIEYLRTVK